MKVWGHEKRGASFAGSAPFLVPALLFFGGQGVGDDVVAAVFVDAGAGQAACGDDDVLFAGLVGHVAHRSGL